MTTNASPKSAEIINIDSKRTLLLPLSVYVKQTVSSETMYAEQFTVLPTTDGAFTGGGV